MGASTAEQEVCATYRAFWRRLVERDAAGLADLLDDSFVLVHMTGRRQPKPAFVESVGTGELSYFDEVEESCVARVGKDAATIVGKSLVEASPFGAPRSWWRLRLDIDLVFRDGRWLMVRAVAGMY